MMNNSEEDRDHSLLRYFKLSMTVSVSFKKYLNLLLKYVCDYLEI